MARRDDANDDETRHHPDDAIEMLKADHQRVRALFQQYEATAAPDRKQQIAEDVLTVLEHHTSREETVFYSAFAVEADEAGVMRVGEAFRDHQLCTVLIEDLRDLAPDDAAFARRWHALRHSVEQHMDAEEREIFPQAAQLLAAEMAEITAAMQEIHEPSLVS